MRDKKTRRVFGALPALRARGLVACRVGKRERLRLRADWGWVEAGFHSQSDCARCLQVRVRNFGFAPAV